MPITGGGGSAHEAEFRSYLTRVRSEVQGGEPVASDGAEHPVVMREEPVVDEADRAQVPEQLRDWIRRVLKQYSLFFVAYAPFAAAVKAKDEASRGRNSLGNHDVELPAEPVVTANIQATVDECIAMRQMIELQPTLDAPATELSALLDQFEAYYKAFPTDFTSDVVEIRALVRQCAQVSSAMRGVINIVRRSIVLPHARCDETAVRAAAKRTERIAALAAAIVKAFEAHCKAKRLTAEIKELYEKQRDLDRYRRNVDEPEKPSAEEVIQFVEAWFERKRESMEIMRAAYLAFREQQRALSERREGLISIRETLYRLPDSSKVGDDYQYAVIEEAKAVQSCLKDDDRYIDASKEYKMVTLAPALEKPVKAEKEQELAEAMRAEIEMVAYCVGARNFARRDWEQARREAEPQPPQVSDGFESGDAYVKALRVHRKALAEHRSAIFRKECLLDARGMQLHAVVARLNRTVEKALRLQRATDGVLLPREVSETMVWLFGREGNHRAR